MKELRTSAEWEKHRAYTKIKILDPDGWDRTNFQYSFYEEKIARGEFELRLCNSTIQCPTAILLEMAKKSTMGKEI